MILERENGERGQSQNKKGRQEYEHADTNNANKIMYTVSKK